MVVPFAPRRRGAARRLQDRAPQDPRASCRRECCARRASSGSATTTPASSSCRPTRRSAPTCARSSASTTSCSTWRSRRTGPTRWASSAWRAISPRTSACRSPSRSTSPRPIVDEVAGAHVIVEAPDRCPRFVALAARGHDGRVAGLDAAPLDAGGHAADQQRRRRHELRHARTLPARCTRSISAGSPGRGIVVRLAREGEKMTTLDGVERTLDRCGSARSATASASPQGIAGIMGGAAAEVSDTTTEILLESAYFEPSGIARTSKRLGLRSEASARFERGVDPNNAGSGAARAMELFAQVADAVPAAGAIDVYPQPIERRAHHRAHRAGQPTARHRAVGRRHRRATSRPSASRCTAPRRPVAHVPARTSSARST